ncbi:MULTISPECIES: polysialyltransferase family glycosyltransferase [unclassified Streptomyces]|uniref:polysialyltransferase family glycosyltransferase n=1 Tax=unclassified Streptomyces TaxID=2593676 RepID=UPI0022B5EC86|nr:MULTISPECIES: polysialyltransferase family glycosyltransferase [unclassified Streptomyces]MCZ7414699.1 polysialyltransferase family glycosyltransferase [Streptomyces sp. WMMC897]MCZ7431628.1 polysialyltransferase family glycosyltransferase [Streptomyces sp. WMMC1477]
MTTESIHANPTVRHTELRPQIFEVSTLYGAATLAAALDAGLFGPAEAARRVLLVSNNAAVPETATPLGDMAGWAGIVTRFDLVVDWNATIRPLHPSDWSPAEQDAPLWQRVFREAWGLGEGIADLVVESVHANPAAALARIFADADVHVYADGLMSYGPTREALPAATAPRIVRLLHLDLVPGLRPLLLSEYEVASETVPDAAFRAVLDELTAVAADDPEVPRDSARAPGAVILGQYLAALGILSTEEEEELHARMLRAAAAAGHERVLFKPHPTAPSRYSRALEKAAADCGVELLVPTTSLLAEAVFGRCRPRLVVGCFSTALFTAATYYGIPAARVGTDLLLDRIVPYQNSNRVPLTIVDALLPDLEASSSAEPRGDVGPLVRTVGYCMQPRQYAALRAEAHAWLEEHFGTHTQRYFKRRRLTSLELPGSLAPAGGRFPGGGAALRVARRVRRAANRRR